MASVWLEAHGKAVVVKGDTMQIKDFIKEKGGRWNAGLKVWIFPGSKKDALLADLRGCSRVKKVEDKTGTSGDAAPAATVSAAAGSSPKAQAPAAKKREAPAEQGDEQVFELPDLVKVRISKYMGKLGVDVRKFYADKASGEEKPTPKGICFSVVEWEALCSATRQINDVLKKGDEAPSKVEGDIMASVQSGSLDLRRFWVDKSDGESKPGKKGIRLSAAQWEALQAAMTEISSAVASEKAGSAASESSPSKKRKAAPKSSSASAGNGPDGSKLRECLTTILKGRDMQSISLKIVRGELEAALSLPAGGLLHRKEEVKGIVTDLIQSGSFE